MKQRYLVDSHKFLTAFVILFMIAYHQQWGNITGWVYLALHGTYGMIWLIKSAVFPDKRWEQKVNTVNAIGLWTTLALYWIAPWLLLSRGIEAPPIYLAVCISIYTVGIFLHYTADMQKHMSLKYNPGHLIKDGLWSRIRNPNYLGELLIYLGYGLLAMHWLPLLVIVGIFFIIWVPNMRQKDKSLARYSEFESYQKQSYRILPLIY